MINQEENKMVNKQQKLEERLGKLISQAKKEWGSLSGGGKIRNCIMRSGSARIYYGPKNEELFVGESLPRINRGEYIIFDHEDYPNKFKIYSPNLRFQFSYGVDKKPHGPYADCNGNYRDYPMVGKGPDD
jgi:hypothetical protein